MHFFSISLLTLVILVSGTIGAQSAGFPYSVPKELQSEVASLAVKPSGYFLLRLKSGRRPPEQWLAQHSQAIGLGGKATLEPSTEVLGIDRRNYHRYVQHLAGAPVLGGDVIAQTDGRGNLRQLSGHLAPKGLFSAPAPAPQNLPDDELERAAKLALTSDYPQALQWNIVDHGDTWTSANPWRPDAQSPLRRCRTLEVVEPAGTQAEMVYVDLRTAKVVFRHPLHCSLHRQLHHRNTSNANIVWREGDAFPGTLNAEDQEMIYATEEVFNLYYRSFGRRGYDGEGGQMRFVSQASMGNCPNARAFNNTVLACSGVVGDDIVGHEWTHNYTTAMNGLLLLEESGSIQESFADIFGEAVDLLNDRGIDDNDALPRDGCFTDNYRWSIAEDATAIDTILRDLWSPTCKTDPDRRYSNLFVCRGPNGTDIHSNSAVLSRTFALLVDGDTTLTPSVRGIGLTKALHIFYHANANYVTRVTNFSALATMLQQSAQDLQGINLPALTLVNAVAPRTNDSITDADLASLDSAIAVTELALPSQCFNLPVLAQEPPESCHAGEQVLIPVFREDWEGDTTGWQFTETPVNPEDWSSKPWRHNVIPLPDGRPGRAMFAPNANVGNCRSDLENGSVALTSPLITLPAAATEFQLQFTHYFSLEPNTDGGLVRYRLLGEDVFTPVPQEAFTYNGYNLALNPASINNNPLAGQPAFSGADNMTITGTWGKSMIDLSSLGLSSGSQFQLQWVLGHDGCDGWLGWYVDDITVGFCGSAALPVSYLSFTATAAKHFIDLNWQTAAEVDNAGFYVERSHGAAFQPLGFVRVTAGGAYTFRDTEVSPGITYVYRLRQLDRDGSEHYSDLVSAVIPREKALLVYPNPSPGTFQVSGTGEHAVVYDLSGRQLLRQPLEDGRCQMEGLRAGVYLVRVGKEARRVVVTR